MPVVESHRTALRRYEMSRPLKAAIRDGVVLRSDSILDYGCGHGSDLALLEKLGYQAVGWDPAFRAGNEPEAADVVNLGYVINVIPDIKERTATLRRAFALSRDLLIVAAQLDIYQNKSAAMKPFADGYLTTRNTFQRLYSQEDLKSYLRESLGLEPVPAAPGVFYLFKNPGRQELLFQTRVRNQAPLPRLPRPTLEQRYAEHKDLLETFAQVTYELGRMPTELEFGQATELQSAIGSFKKAHAIAAQLFPTVNLEEARTRRVDDLLVYLALAQFRPQPKLSELTESLREDMRCFFGSYLAAREAGKQLLFQVSSPEKITEACQKAAFGKKLPDDLYLHTRYRDELPALLRVYVGCAQALVGTIEGGNIIKIHMRSGKVSYLEYPTFDREAHPRLKASTTVLLREQRIRYRDYSEQTSAPVLHRKETLVKSDYPRYKAFSELTQAEEAAGLLQEAHTIGFSKEWSERLATRGFAINGHRLTKL